MQLFDGYLIFFKLWDPYIYSKDTNNFSYQRDVFHKFS